MKDEKYDDDHFNCIMRKDKKKNDGDYLQRVMYVQ